MCPRPTHSPTLVHRSPYSRSPNNRLPPQCQRPNVRCPRMAARRAGARIHPFAFRFLPSFESRSVRGSVTPARSPRQRPGQNRDAPTDHVFAGGLRSLLDSARESYPDTARGSRTRLFQSVYPRSALVAQCRLRWFVNPACRGAEQIVSWGPSSMLSVLPESSYPVSSISNERTMFDLPDLHAGHVRQFFFFLIRWVRLLAVLVKP